MNEIIIKVIEEKIESLKRSIEYHRIERDRHDDNESSITDERIELEEELKNLKAGK